MLEKPEIGRVDHIGIAVTNLEEALRFYQEVLGLSLSGVEEVPGQQVRVAMLPVGESRVELLQSTSPEGTIARFIEKRGEGIHHICYEVANIEQALAALKATDTRLIDEKPRLGAGGHRVAFVHPRSTHGVLIELSERPADGKWLKGGTNG